MRQKLKVKSYFSERLSVAWPANMIQISVQVNEIIIVISSPITHVISAFLTARLGILIIEHLHISMFDSEIIHFTWVISLQSGEEKDPLST